MAPDHKRWNQQSYLLVPFFMVVQTLDDGGLVMINYVNMSSSKASSIAAEVLVAMNWSMQNMELAIDTFDGNQRQENEIIETLEDLIYKMDRIQVFYDHQLSNQNVAVPDYVLGIAEEFLLRNSWGMGRT